MPRARFAKLDLARQTAILDAAAEEFAIRGFREASINKIIARLASNKGSMYYYFDDKEDLFRAVLKGALEQAALSFRPLIERPVFSKTEYWEFVGSLYLHLLQIPQRDRVTGGLLRAALRAAHDGQRIDAVTDVRRKVDQHLEALIEMGQGIGAVRADLPLELLCGMVLAILETCDQRVVERIEPIEHADPQTASTQRAAIAGQALDALRRLVTPDPEKGELSLLVPSDA